MRYVEQAADNQWVIKENPLCLIDLLNAIHEQQCCGGVADLERERERETADVTARFSRGDGSNDCDVACRKLAST